MRTTELVEINKRGWKWGTYGLALAVASNKDLKRKLLGNHVLRRGYRGITVPGGLHGTGGERRGLVRKRNKLCNIVNRVEGFCLPKETAI